VQDGVERTADRPWEAVRPHTVAGETFEAYPNRDSLPYLARYRIPASWRTATFLRGTLRLAGWVQAWQDVFAEIRAGDDERIAALAAELAARYPATPADRDRVVLAVALTVRDADGDGWSGEYVLDIVGDETETAMARCVSVPLAVGVTDILAGRLPAGLRTAEDGPDGVRSWLSTLRRHGLPWRFSEHSEPKRPVGPSPATGRARRAGGPT